ncbi:hypothetical protein KY310_04625, partial [Candidatus Woesearchaeota archaeon]|nr:hypothetical protein [Candidatus Woesearchaeota archaeon]
MKNKLMILLIIVLLTSFAAAFQMDVGGLQDRPSPVQSGFDFTDMLADDTPEPVIETVPEPFIDIASQLTDTSSEPIIDTSPDEFGFAGKLKDKAEKKTEPVDIELDFTSKLADKFDALAEGLKDTRVRIIRNATGYYRGQSIKL